MRIGMLDLGSKCRSVPCVELKLPGNQKSSSRPGRLRPIGNWGEIFFII